MLKEYVLNIFIDKIAFRGTINYKNNEDGAVDQSQVNGMPSIKKRKQKD